MKANSKEIKCIRYAEQFYIKERKLRFFGHIINRIQYFLYPKEYSVSKTKTFVQLWSDFGLRDYGVDYWDRGTFTSDDKLDCMEMWVKTLYNKNVNLSELENKIIRETQEQRVSIMKNTQITHISFSNSEDIMPDEIDKIYGCK